MLQILSGRKTYIIAGLMACTSLVHLLTGDITIAQFFMGEHVNTLLQAMGLGTLRAGIQKKGY